MWIKYRGRSSSSVSSDLKVSSRSLDGGRDSRVLKPTSSIQLLTHSWCDPAFDRWVIVIDVPRLAHRYHMSHGPPKTIW